MYKKIIKALYESKISRSINESYATVKDRFIKDGADKAEVKYVLNLHKKLKDMRRLKDDEINIDVLAKGKSFDEFKTLMSKYSEKDTATKTDKFNELKNNIVAENSEWIVYKIDTAEEAYLFHGLTKWCIVSGSKSDAEEYFERYVFDKNSNFYFIVRKNPIDDKWDYIALQLQQNNKTYWDKNDGFHKTLPDKLNVPNLNISFKPMIRPIPKSWKLNSDGSYDVDGNVDLEKFKQFTVDSDRKLTIKFNKVTGNFDCNYLKLTSLKGSPKEVGGDFYCSSTDLTSLDGAPNVVGGDFSCYNNNLSSLEGAPKEVGGLFDCSSNKLTSLKGAPEKVGGDFYCSNNKLTSLIGSPKEIGENFHCYYNKLTSLDGAPKIVGGGFYCEHNKLTSLKGAPEKVGGDFYCNDNKLISLIGCPEKVDRTFYCDDNKLTSLEGAPKIVGRDFDCSNNKLTSLNGCPKEVGDVFFCRNNEGKRITKSDIVKVCKVGDEVYV